MRKLLAIGSTLLLALAVTAPIAVAQGEPYVTDASVTSVTVDKMGLIIIRGTVYCQNMDDWDIGIGGQVIQAIGRKVTIRGGMGGGMHCNPNGPSYWETGAWADTGKFAPGWATLQVTFGNWWCDEFGCYDQIFGGGDFYVKVTKR